MQVYSASNVTAVLGPGGLCRVRFCGSGHNPRLNIITEEIGHQLQDAVATVIRHPEVAAVAVWPGGDVFSTGGDIYQFARYARDHREEGLRNYTQLAYTLFGTLRDSRKPTYAVINGPSFGGGAELALACHHTIATERASLCFPEISFGAVMLTPFWLAKRVGPGAAFFLMATGNTKRPLVGKEILHSGFARHVVRSDELDGTVSRIVASEGQMPERTDPQQSIFWKAVNRLFESPRVREKLVSGGVLDRMFLGAIGMQHVADNLPQLGLANQMMGMSDTGNLTGLFLEMCRQPSAFAPYLEKLAERERDTSRP